MCMACGLMDHDGGRKEYARNRDNSPPTMRNSYSGGQERYSQDR